MSEAVESVYVPLPDWYPLANAAAEEVSGWLKMDTPPYADMQLALPWLTTLRELEWWLAGVREADALGAASALRACFPGIEMISQSPHRDARMQP